MRVEKEIEIIIYTYTCASNLDSLLRGDFSKVDLIRSIPSQLSFKDYASERCEYAADEYLVLDIDTKTYRISKEY